VYDGYYPILIVSRHIGMASIKFSTVNGMIDPIRETESKLRVQHFLILLIFSALVVQTGCLLRSSQVPARESYFEAYDSRPCPSIPLL